MYMSDKKLFIMSVCVCIDETGDYFIFLVYFTLVFKVDLILLSFSFGLLLLLFFLSFFYLLCFFVV